MYAGPMSAWLPRCLLPGMAEGARDLPVSATAECRLRSKLTQRLPASAVRIIPSEGDN